MKNNNLTVNSKKFSNLPPQCIIVFKLAFDDTEIKYLRSLSILNSTSSYDFLIIGGFIIFKDLDLLNTFFSISETKQNSSSSIKKLLPAYVKINNMFLTINNFKGLISEFKKGNLEENLTQQSIFPINSNLAFENILGLTSKAVEETNNSPIKNIQ